MLGATLIAILAFSAVSCGGKHSNAPATATPSPSITQLPITRSTPIASSPRGDEESASVNTGSEEASSEPESESPAQSEADPEPSDPPASDPSPKPSSNVPPPSPPPNVQFGMVKSAPPGQVAHVMVQSAANTTCSLKFVGPDNTESTAEGLGSKTTDAQGRAYWDWKVDPQTPTGTGTATATCDDVSVSVPMKIGGVG